MIIKTLLKTLKRSVNEGTGGLICAVRIKVLYHIASINLTAIRARVIEIIREPMRASMFQDNV